MHPNKKNNGFTLFEVMIVLVVIGLATGGVLTGQAIMKSAALKSLNDEIQAINMAHNQFRMEYNGIAGDFAEAQRFWGEAHNNNWQCANMDKSAMTATCNGDGDGIIDDNYEMYYQWHHLKNAGLIEGTYTGAYAAGGGYDHDVGINSPASKFKTGSGFAIREGGNKHVGNNSGGGGNNWFDGHYGHILMFGVEMPGETNLPKWPALTVDEMAKFDAKFDDGWPAKGRIVSRGSAGSGTHAFPNCTQKSATDDGIALHGDLDAVYRLSYDSNEPACQLIFRKVLE